MSYRTTISIPEDLKEQMDAVGDGVNWSAVAAQAFRAKVFEIQSRKVTKMKTADIVKRLRASAESDTEDYDDGKHAGREWATTQATARELGRLNTYLEDTTLGRFDWWDVDDPRWMAPWGAADNLAFAIRPKLRKNEDPQEVRAFWQSAIGDDALDRLNDSEFLRGFGEGAAEVWEEVKNEL
jgi:hypothetical protein